MKNSSALTSILAAWIATTVASVALAQSGDPLTRLAECMKLPAASAQQDACIAETRSLQAAMPKAAPAPKPAAMAAAAAQPMAAAGSAAPRAMPGAAPTAASAAPVAQANLAPATTPPKVMEVPSEVKRAAQQVGLAGSPAIAAPAGARNVDVSGMDLDTLMMMVQVQRADLLDAQFNQEAATLGDRNKQVMSLEDILGTLNGALAAAGPSVKPDAMITVARDDAGKAFIQKMQAAKADATWLTTRPDKGSTLYQAPRSKVDASVQQIKARIDALNGAQQMNMIRLQALDNKRNQAFETMNNFIHRMADSRATVIGNLR